MTSLPIHWRQTLELLTPEELGCADAAAIAGGVPGFALMEKAGEAVADAAAGLILAQSRRTPRVAVLCGPGNNGGDGYVAARYLAKRGFVVTCFALGDQAALKADAADAARAWTGTTHRLPAFAPENFDLVIDALFGAGLTRVLDGDAAEAVGRLNEWRQASGGRVLAVDVPSGLDGASGQVRGLAVEADATVTFFRLKPGHVLMPGRKLCGDLHLAHIGIPDHVLPNLAGATFLNGPALWSAHLPRLDVEGHKYTRGHVLVVSGPEFHTGAARLAACAAARAGAGLVTIAGAPAALKDHASHVTAIMLAPMKGTSDLVQLLADARKNALVIGPGLGLGVQAHDLLEAALQDTSARALVVDADALTLMARDMARAASLIQARIGPVILTPHEGEFSRLAKPLAHSFVSHSLAPDSKLERARWLAKATGAVVLLKGPDTIVAAPDSRASIATDLPPSLATAGSGDVLAGIISGLLAQGMAAFEAASAAVWLHGQAAARVGRGLTADDLPEALAQVLGSWKGP